MIRQIDGRWEVILSPEDEADVQRRVSIWMGYKGNDANLFGGGAKAKAAGIRGEIALKRLLEHHNVPFIYGGTDGEADKWDFKIHDKIYSLKTQREDRDPNANHRVLLAEQQTKHPADYYVFCFNRADSQAIVFLGQILKEDFLLEADYLVAGTKVDKFEVKNTCFSRRIRALSELAFLNGGQSIG